MVAACKAICSHRQGSTQLPGLRDEWSLKKSEGYGWWSPAELCPAWEGVSWRRMTAPTCGVGWTACQCASPGLLHGLGLMVVVRGDACVLRSQVRSREGTLAAFRPLSLHLLESMRVLLLTWQGTRLCASSATALGHNWSLGAITVKAQEVFSPHLMWLRVT